MSKAIIFDFDGTLVDSERTIYKCFQSITRNIAPERINYAKNILIGPPLRDTAGEILGPKHQNKLEEFISQFINMHDEQATKHTHPYPYVIETLKELNEKKIIMGIATNKRRAPTMNLIKHFSWQKYFSSIECSDSKNKVRSKHEMIQDILNNDRTFYKAFFIGDTVNDGLSANLNELPFVKALYGYGKNQDWSKINIDKEIRHFSEIIKLF